MRAGRAGDEGGKDYRGTMNGDELKAWMTEHGRTVRGLAFELDVSRATVQRWRDDEARIPESVALALQVLARRRPPPPGTGREVD